MVEQIDPLLGPDFVDAEEVFGHGELQVLALLVHFLRDLAGGQLRSMET